MRYLSLVVFGLFFMMSSVFAADEAAAPAAKPDKTVWKFEFHDVVPNKPDVTVKYCRVHSPDKLKASIEQLGGSGKVAKNGVIVKYKDFVNSSKFGVDFVEINATVSGVADEKQWQNDMYINLQKLDPTGDTKGVWATPDCKGWVSAEVD